MHQDQSYKFIPQLPHGEKWSQGYNVATNCEEFRKDMEIHLRRLSGPKSGDKITMRGIPTSETNDDVFLRFWASRGGHDSWKSFKVAYDIEEDQMESMPSSDYTNGGMVKVSKNGIARFSLNLPTPYEYINPVNDKAMLIPSHFHYRLCYGKKMGPVQTQFID